MIHQRNRVLVPDRAVRSYRVVVSTPSLQLFPRIGEAHEPVLVQAFCPEPPIEGLDEGIVSRLSGP